MNNIAYWTDVTFAILGLIAFVSMIGQAWFYINKGIFTFAEQIDIWAASFRLTMYQSKVLAIINWTGMGLIYGFTTYYGYWLSVYVQILFFVLMAAVFVIEYKLNHRAPAV